MTDIDLRIEETITTEVTVDPIKLIEAFPEEFAEFMEGAVPTDEDIRDFVIETVHQVGAAEFTTDDTPWASFVATDHDLYVTRN